MTEKIDPIKLTLPRPVADTFKISSLVGWRKINGKPDFHSGIDFAVPPGTPIKAVADGVCFRCGWENEQNQKQGFGLRVWQEFKYDDFMVYAWYAHLSVTLLTEGASIAKGQVIGLSGSTGRSTGPHLHIEFRRKNTPIRFDVNWINA